MSPSSLLVNGSTDKVEPALAGPVHPAVPGGTTVRTPPSSGKAILIWSSVSSLHQFDHNTIASAMRPGSNTTGSNDPGKGGDLSSAAPFQSRSTARAGDRKEQIVEPALTNRQDPP
jgi:hypothetical protein